jgi:hypothetical protein
MVFINTTFPKRNASCFNWVCQCTGGWCIAPVGVYQGGADVHPSIPAEIRLSTPVLRKGAAADDEH